MPADPVTLTKANPATENNDGKSEPAPTPPPTPPSTSTEDTSKVLAESEVKKAFLKRFRKRKSPQINGQTTDTPKTEGDNTKGLNSNDLAEKLYRDIAATQRKEYIMFRISKRAILLTTGVFLLVMWLSPLVRLVTSNFGIGSPAITGQSHPSSTPTVTPTIEADSRINDPNILIRIRDNGGAGMAASLQSFLQAKGYRQVELYDDHGSQYTGLGVVVKPNALELRQEMEAIIGERYAVTSPSAELTEDSQVDALILFGLDDIRE